MVDHAKTPSHEAAHDDAAKPPSADRRRWLKAGLSTAPVLMTVASRPVLAQTCVPPSAHMSLGASAPGTDQECSGFGPDTWAGSRSWPGNFTPHSRFNDHFGRDLIGNPKFSDVLDYKNIANVSDTVHTVARYVTAALLNHASGKVPETVLRPMTIQYIWNEFTEQQSFAPTRGVSWSAAEIVDYLKSTMTSK
jgi:hypothetical protein